MPAKIDTIEKLLGSTRFKKGTNNRKFTDLEIKELEKLFNHIMQESSLGDTGTYSVLLALASYDITDLVNRFKYLKENSTQRTQETYLARYGKIEGEKRWASYCEKQRIKNLFETKREKYGWTKDQFNDFNKSRAVTKDLMIERHGPSLGKEKWDNYIDRQRYTNSLRYYEEKYGPDAGYDQWLNYNKEKGKSGKLAWIMEKYNVDESGALKIASDQHPKSHSSAAELSFIDALESLLGETIKYTAKTKQFSIWNRYSDGICFFDIVNSERKKIIEFHGDYWHCNPAKYSADFIHPHSGLSAKEIWKRDFYKIKCALDRGFSVKIVWWSDYENNKDEIIEECATWLQK